MLAAAVRIDLVDDDLQPEFVRAQHQCVKFGKRAEQRVDVAIVADIISEVRHRRPEEGGQPDRIDAQRRDMAEMPGNPGQIPYPVAIGIREAARIDLVNDGAAPPLALVHGRAA